MKGILVTVLKNALGDCTNNGISNKATTLLLVGEGVPEVCSSSESMLVVKLVKRNLNNGEYLHCEPIEGRGYKAGGNYIFSSDSRFKESVSKYPIAIHDRVER